MSYKQLPLRFIPGINPEPDQTKQNTAHIIDGDNVRFFKGNAEKFGGHSEMALSNSISGTPRSRLTFSADDIDWEIIATNSHLYAKNGGTVTNITPLKTSGTTLGSNPGRTRYDDVQVTPLTTANGSTLINVATFLYTAIQAGDQVEISGVVGSGGELNGIPITEINKVHTIVDVPGSYFRIRTTTAATSSGSPTESGTVIVIRKFRLAHTAHGMATGDRIKVSGFSGTVGGVPDTEINGEHIIQRVDANNYVFPITTTATSDATGGGASVIEYQQIDSGGEDATAATGPGIGLPGMGLPGQIFTDTSLIVQPRIWWLDTYGDTLVCGPGQQGDCFQWLGDTDTAPTKITNSPAADWGWIEAAKLVILSGNTVANSGTGDLTDWTPAADSSAYSDDKEDATNLITRIPVGGENLVFADENKVFRLRWVGGAVKWFWEKISDTVEIAGPNAGISMGGIAYIIGKDNLYYFNGGIFAPLPNNTLFKYMFENINLTQRYKFFNWYNQKCDEIWFHYASLGSDENDRVVVVNRAEGHFTKREGLDRTAADKGGQVIDYPVLADSSGSLWQHEIGYDDGSSAMDAYIQIAYQALSNGDVLTDISGMEPDLIQTGDLTVELYGKDRSQQDGTLLESFTFGETDNKIDCGHETRWRSWLIRSNTLGGFFQTGGIKEFIMQGSDF